jgi:hypothetical protein
MEPAPFGICVATKTAFYKNKQGIFRREAMKFHIKPANSQREGETA